MLLTLIVAAVNFTIQRSRRAGNAGMCVPSQIFLAKTSPARLRRSVVVVSGVLFLSIVIALGASAALFARSENAQQLIAPMFADEKIAGDREVSVPSVASAVADERLATIKTALEEEMQLLTNGREWLSKQAGYTATFLKQERIQDRLGLAEEMRIALRHAPFSVRLDWPDSGQRVVYVDGQNENLLLVRLGGAKRLFGTLKLDPHSDRVMETARHPITEFGLLNLADRIWNQCQFDLAHIEGVDCARMPDEALSCRSCAVFVVAYHEPTVNPDYRSTRISIDLEWGIPVRIQATGWLASMNRLSEGEDQILELYEYRDVKFMNEVSPSQFAIASRQLDEGH